MITAIRRLKRKLDWFFQKRKFAALGEGSVIPRSIKCGSKKNITIGKNVGIGRATWIDAVPLAGGGKSCVVLKDGATIGEFNHIYATSKIVFEADCLTANFVYITDNLHSYEDVHTPIVKQPIKQLKPVVIGKGCWIGEHVSIIGASIGEGAVVGSNAVVTKDIPPFCVAVGAPAFIIKRYDPERGKWRKTNKQGDFIDE